jgi:hypothetical protein
MEANLPDLWDYKMTDFEKHYIQVSRSLAMHLHRYARERREDDKKAIAAAQMELCQIWKAEQAER